MSPRPLGSHRWKYASVVRRSILQTHGCAAGFTRKLDASVWLDEEGDPVGVGERGSRVREVPGGGCGLQLDCGCLDHWSRDEGACTGGQGHRDDNGNARSAQPVLAWRKLRRAGSPIVGGIPTAIAAFIVGCLDTVYAILVLSDVLP
jgi:hypothetical protein